MRQSIAVLLPLLLACSAAEGTSTDGTTTPDPNKTDGTQVVDPGNPNAPPIESSALLASGVAITSIAMFQATRLDIVKERVAQPSEPVIAGRPGILRIYVKPESGAGGKEITAILYLKRGEKKLEPITVTKKVSKTSSDSDSSSVFDFSLKGEDITPDTSYAVALTVAEGGEKVSADSKARFPATGEFATLGATSATAKLKVVLVPVRYGADGSQRLPEVSTSQIEIYRSVMKAFYPVSEVEVTVRAPLTWSKAISPTGPGWGEILNALIQLRSTERPAENVYYFGSFAPSSSFATFCGRGCVTGLSGLANSPRDSSVRASVGVGYPGEESAKTMAHEIGHANGREHAPSGGASDTDPSFPYAGGGVGVWGYNLSTGKFVDPGGASGPKDMMGYGSPTWISDYTYKGLFKWLSNVTGMAANITGQLEPLPYRVAQVDGDGNVRWDSEISLKTEPDGQARTTTILNDSNQIVGTTTARFYPYDHLPGGVLIAPSTPLLRGTSITVEGVSRRIALPR